MSSEYNTKLSTGTDNLSIKKPRKGRYATSIYQEFADASAYAFDDYWATKLEEASRGKFPDDIRYESGVLSYRCNKKTRSILIPLSDPALCASEFRKFIRDNAKLHSELDIAAANFELISAETKRSNVNIYSYIEPFISYCISLYNFSPESVMSLRTTLTWGIRVCAIIKDDIHITGDKITYINGLIFDNNTGLFSISNESIDRANKLYLDKLNHETNIHHPMYNSRIDKKKVSKWEYMAKQFAIAEITADMEMRKNIITL